MAQAKAALANATAVQGRTDLDVKRYKPLAQEQAASQQDLDNAVQNNLAAMATMETAKAQIKTSEAAVETARLNLGFTRLIAPIDGIEVNIISLTILSKQWRLFRLQKRKR